MKLRFLPHRREIDEYQEATRYAKKNRLPVSAATLASLSPEKHELDDAATTHESTKPSSIDSDTLFDETEWEVRDEAKRKWYTLFFKDSEYKRPPKNHQKMKWYHWFQPGDTPEEQRLVSKLDILICFYSFVIYWVKFLDQANINNAYVSGMKEELHMTGNDLVHTQIMYTVGSVVFQIPFMYVIHKVPCHYILPLMDIGWGMFTLAIYRANSVRELQAYRFFVGVFESAFYPTIQYLFGSWYRPSEYGRRGGFFYFGQMLGLLTSGLLQSASYKHLSGIHGLSGWRWLFIIDAIITIPVGIIGFFSIPGTPKKCYSLWLTDEEIYLSRKRMREANISLETRAPSFFNIKLWKKVLSDWRIYMFTAICLMFWNNSNANSGSYLLWLKSLDKYSVPIVNQYSTITPALGFAWIIIAAFISDQLDSRVGTILFTQTLNVLGNIILAVWHLPQGVLWFAFCLQYLGWASATSIYGWCSDATRDDPQIRVIAIVVMNMLGQASAALTSSFVWRTVEAPRFLKGFTFTACCAFVMMLLTIPLMLLYKRDERKNAFKNKILLYNSAKGEVPPEIPGKTEPTKAVPVGDKEE